MSADLKLYLNPLSTQLVQPVNFVEYFSSVSNLSHAQKVRLVHVYIQGDFGVSEEEFLGEKENVDCKEDLRTRSSSFSSS